MRGGGGPDGAFILGMICGGIVIFLIALAISAVILRAAVWAANKCLPQPRSRYDDDYDDWDDDYDRPRRRRRGRASTAIPTPSMGHAMGIVFVNGIIGFVIGFVIGLMFGLAGLANNPGGQIMLQGLNLGVGFLVAASVLTMMLPTTFPRACLVVLFQYLIAIAIAIVIVVPIVILILATRGGM